MLLTCLARLTANLSRYGVDTPGSLVTMAAALYLDTYTAIWNNSTGYCHVYCIPHFVIKSKGLFFYSTVSSPWDCSKCFTLHPWQTCSFQGHFDFSGKHSAMLQLLCEHYSFRYPPLSVARYSFIQLVELWQHGVNRIASFKWQQEALNLGFSIERTAF